MMICEHDPAQTAISPRNTFVGVAREELGTTTASLGVAGGNDRYLAHTQRGKKGSALSVCLRVRPLSLPPLLTALLPSRCDA